MQTVVSAASQIAELFSSQSERFRANKATLVKYLKNFLNYCFRSDDSKEIQEELAKMLAYYSVEEILKFPPDRRHNLEEVDIPGTYLDLASGSMFGHFFGNLNPVRKYVAIEQSFFIASYLKALAELFGKKHLIDIIMDNILEYEPEEEYAVIRAKNIWEYVLEYYNEPIKFFKYTDHLKAGGMLVLETEPGYPWRNSLLAFSSSLIIQWIQEGWGFEYLPLLDGQPDILKLKKPKNSG